MKRTVVSFLLAVLLSAVCLAQSSAGVQAGGSASQNTSASADKSGAQASSTSSAEAASQANASGKHGSPQAASARQLESGSTVQAELTKPVDVRKNKPGDEVIAKTTEDVKSDGKVVLPKGSRIGGKVTQAQARGKGQDESQLGIAFDHAILKDGSQMPVSFAIQAVGSSESAASATVADDSAMMGGNAGGMARGSGSGAVGSRGGLAGGVRLTSRGGVDSTGRTAGASFPTWHSAWGKNSTKPAGRVVTQHPGRVRHT